MRRPAVERNTLKNFFRALVSFGLFVVLALFVGFFETQSPVRAATAPTIITYQGKLLVNSLSATAALDMKFVIYDADSGGNAVYSASGTVGTPLALTVTPTNGIFTVQLGDASTTNAISPDIFKNNSSLYLEVIIGSETLSPRKQITAAPYAFNAKFLDGVAATSTVSSSAYIPIADSLGNFRFKNVTSTQLVVGGASATTTYGFRSITFSNGAYITASTTLMSDGSSTSTFDQSTVILGASTGFNKGYIFFDGSAGSSGAISASGTLTVYSLSTLRGGFISNASSSVGAGLQVAGALNASGTLQTAGATVLGSTLSVSSLSTLAGFISTASSSVSAGLQVAGALNASSSLQVAGDTNLGDSDNSADTTRIFGSLTIGQTPLGDALLKLKATSTTAIPFLVQDNDGNTILQAASTTVYAIDGQTYSDVSISGYASILQVGNTTKPGMLVLRGVSNNVDGSVILYRNSTAIGTQINSTQITMGSGSVTSTFNPSAFNFGKTTSAGFGVLSIDSSGNVSASGTLQVFGASTFSTSTFSGNVGIGLTSPEYQLTVKASSTTAIPFLVQNSVGGTVIKAASNTASMLTAITGAQSNYNGVSILDVGSASTPGSVRINGSGPLILADSSGQTVGMIDGSTVVLTNGGGSRTSTFAHNTIVLAAVPTARSGVFIVESTGDTSASGTLQVYGVATFVTSTFSGNVGIGFTGPEHQLSIRASSTTAVPFNIAGTSNQVIFRTSSSSAAFFTDSTGNAEQIYNNLALVDVGSSGSNGLTGVLRVNNYGALVFSDNDKLVGAISANSAVFSNRGGTSTSTYGNDSIVLHTSSDKLGGVFSVDVSGNISSSGTGRLFGALFASSTFDASGTSTFFATTTFAVERGRVGIGTSSPQEKFHLVDGSFLLDTPTNPTLIGSSTSTNSITSVAVAGRYAYVLNSTNSNFQIYDISTPSAPYMLSQAAAGVIMGYSRSIAVSGRYAFSGDGGTNLRVYDISNPTAVTVFATMNGSSNGQSVYVSGRYAYLTQDNGGLHVVDITNPTTASYSTNYSSSTPANKAVYVVGRYAYLMKSTRLVVLDISTSTAATTASTVGPSPSQTGVAYGFTDARDIFVVGRYAYVADGSGGLRIVDVSDPANPVVASTLTLSGGTARSVMVAGKYAYVAENATMKVIDVSSSTLPALVGTYTDSGTIQSLVVSGRYAYIGTSNGFKVIDIKGADISAATIGNISTHDLSISDNGIVGNNLYVQNGLNVGFGGILSNGPLAVSNTLQLGQSLVGGFTVSSTLATTTFMSFSSNAKGSAGFLFNTLNSFTSTTAGTPLDRVLFAVANAGTNKFEISGGGNVYASKSFIANSVEYGIGDVAEYVDLDPGSDAEAGDVLVVSTSPNRYRKSTSSHATAVAGVISDTGAFVIGAAGLDRAPLALTGVVNTKVTAENGSIAIGDYLVTASEPGYAMRYDLESGQSAAIIGMAVESLATSTGKIKVLLNKGLVGPSASALSRALTVETGDSNKVKVGGTTSTYNLELSDNFAMTKTGLNQLTFATTSLFTSSVGNLPGARAFIFTAANFLPNSADTYILSLRAGDEAVFSVKANGDVLTNGTVQAAGFITGTSTLDLAETYPIDPSCAATGACPEAGDAVCLVDGRVATIEKCSNPYDEKAIGIISTKPGFTLGGQGTLLERKVALAGRVPVKLSTKNGPIKVGDKLTTSDMAGVAMKATENGPTIGVALEAFDNSDVGTALAFVKMGWWSPLIVSAPSTPAPEGPVTDFVGNIVEALKSVGLAIKDGIVTATEFIAARVTSDELQTKKLCVEGTCITQYQFKELLDKNNIVTVVTTTPEVAPVPAPVETAPPPVTTSTPDSSTSSTTPVTPEPTPSVAPAPTVVTAEPPPAEPESSPTPTPTESAPASTAPPETIPTEPAVAGPTVTPPESTPPTP